MADPYRTPAELPRDLLAECEEIAERKKRVHRRMMAALGETLRDDYDLDDCTGDAIKIALRLVDVVREQRREIESLREEVRRG